MPKEAKSFRKDARKARVDGKRGAAQRKAEGSRSETSGRSCRRFRWIFVLIGLVGIQVVALLSLWHSHPSDAHEARAASAAESAPGQAFLATKREQVPVPVATPAILSLDFTGDAAEEGDIAVLLIASGRSVSSLKQTLKSLLRSFSAGSILVSQTAPGEASRELSTDLGVGWVGPSPIADFATFDGEAEPWLHYGRSLEHAATKHFVGQTFRSLFVVEEDLIFSGGIFSFLAQLHPLLFQDPSIWCISAWNDYSLSPFAQDVSSLLRSSWFSGRAWMVTLHSIREELLPNWSLQQHWKPLLRQLALASSKECVFPEVSRAAFTSYQCDGVAIRGQCDDEEVQARRLAASAIFARGKVKLGDVSRLTEQQYSKLHGSSWPRNSGLQKAVVVTLVSQLYEDTTTPLLVVIDDQDKAAWVPVLEYFGLPATPERGARNTYRGVVRLRWRQTVLYLASSSSPLLRPEHFPAPVMPMSPKEFQLLPGSGAHRSTGLLPPALQAPWSRATVAELGSSCLLHCASQGELCVDADLAFVARCAPPLTELLRCTSCNDKADSVVFPGLDMRSEACFGAAALPNLPGSKYSTCSAQQEGVQRLCVCRSQGQASELQSASRHFLLRQKEPQRSRAFSATKERRSRPNLQRFGVLLQAGSIPNSALTPNDLSILLVVPDGASEALLRGTLSSLSQTQGFVASTVLLVHSQPKLFIAQVAEDFALQRLQVEIDQRVKRDPDRLSALYKAGFEALAKAGPKLRFVLVLTYGDQLAPDALWYFAQLADVLQRDDSLWAVNGWNDQALAPYAADPTVILRTDWFSGSGWMVTAEVMQEMLSAWYMGRSWEAMFRDEQLRKKRQFLTPEISRVVPDIGWVLDLGDVVTRRQKGHGGHGRPLDPYLFAQNPLCDVPVVDLGDVDRLMERRYQRLFFIDWPGEGLLKTKLLTSLQTLLEGKVNSGGPFRLVYRNSDSEMDARWKAVANFFNLWPDLPMHGSYYGVVRLRWRDTVLFLVPSSSALCTGEMREALLSPEEDAVSASVLPPVPSQIVDPMLFPVASHPLLVPASSELVPADFPGISCSFVCEEAGLQCHSEDLPFINNCDALAALGCRRCESGEGPEHPVQELQGPKAGRCLYNTNLGRYPLTCDASHPGTRRLCICRDTVRLAASVKRKVIVSSPVPEIAVGNGRAESAAQALPETLQHLKPETLAVLVMAGGQRPRMLERCLQALSKAYGYNKNMVFVSQDGDGTQTKIMAQKFHVGWRQVDTGVKSAGEKEALHYKMALQHAVEGPFRDKSVLIILEEDMAVSFDFLLYFAQLQDLLKWEDIFSVSAWNENAIGPLSSNLQHLLRVDSFSGAAWMISTASLGTLLPAWPRNFWQKHLRKVSVGKQNIIPEVPRVRLDRTNFQGASIFVSTQRSLQQLDLGDLGRLSAEVYRNRLIEDLRRATLVEELKLLLPPSKLKDVASDLNWRVHYQSDQPESDGTWSFLARYFQLPEGGQPPMLQGITKLLWGRGFLFLVASSSQLIVQVRLRPLPSEAIPPEAFQEASRPLLLAPNGQLMAAERTGQSCQDFCNSKGGFCAASDLVFANSCEAMRSVLLFLCERCERSMGSDQPALATSRSSRAYGACLYNGDILHHPITCEAWHRDTRRLCVCRDLPEQRGQEASTRQRGVSAERPPEPTSMPAEKSDDDKAETTLKQSAEHPPEPTSMPAEKSDEDKAETTLKQSAESADAAP